MVNGNTAWGEQFVDHHYVIHYIHTEICSLKFSYANEFKPIRCFVRYLRTS